MSSLANVTLLAKTQTKSSYIKIMLCPVQTPPEPHYSTLWYFFQFLYIYFFYLFIFFHFSLQAKGNQNIDAAMHNFLHFIFSKSCHNEVQQFLQQFKGSDYNLHSFQDSNLIFCVEVRKARDCQSQSYICSTPEGWNEVRFIYILLFVERPSLYQWMSGSGSSCSQV